MHLKRNIKKFAAIAAMALVAVSANGQDLLARQAPVDRKMKAVDTVALRNIIEREQAQSLSAQLYSEWSNKYAHQQTELPDSFRIDLRGFHMPTPSRVITSNFGKRWGRMHKGLDVKVYIGDTIRAAFDGKVRIVRYEAGGYGNYVVIRHNNGLETIYGHMSKNIVKEDDVVKAGTPIGLGGNTGRSTGSHLHFETRICGLALNPALLFDFKNQDVTADYYMFRRSNHAKESLAAAKRTQVQDSYTEEEVTGGNATSGKSKDSSRGNSRSKKTSSNLNGVHKVTKGETLSAIARKHGTTVDKLCKKNGISRTTILRPGQKLKLS